ncbi:MAG: PIG-L family deacetylase [Sphaerochaetaceae bacterium]|nr:PIG-L family deacetylase [Sphaerochaetaceae bacterium]
MKILAFGAHPGDVETACFGTLSRCVQREDEVVVCSLTNGELAPSKLTSEDLKMVRMVESAQACAVIGASFCTMDIEEMKVNELDDSQLSKICSLIRSTRPDLIITHSENERHPDAVQTSRIVRRAALLSTLDSYPDELPALKDLPLLYYMDSIDALDSKNLIFVDVGSSFELKMKAVGCHTSQMEIREGVQYTDLLQMIEIIGSYRGLQCGIRMAEAFIVAPSSLRSTARYLP